MLAHLRRADFPRGARIPSKIKTCHVPGRHSICSWQKSSAAPFLHRRMPAAGAHRNAAARKGSRGTSSPVVRVPHPAQLYVRAAQKKRRKREAVAHKGTQQLLSPRAARGWTSCPRGNVESGCRRVPRDRRILPTEGRAALSGRTLPSGCRGSPPV